jgi:tetratricopeptide (TPR) repeat protein
VKRIRGFEIELNIEIEAGIWYYWRVSGSEAMRLLKTLIPLLVILAGLLGCSDNSIEAHRERGKDYYNDGNYREARQEFLAGLAQNPSDEDLLYFAGLAYQKDYMYDSAMYYFKRADIMNPDNREINQQIYQLAIQLNDYANAVSAIDVLARTGDGFEMYYEQLADLYEKNDQPGLAYYWARKATVAGTNDPDVFLLAAGRAADYDSIKVALELLDTAIVKFPDDPRFPGTKALILLYNGHPGQAEAILRPIVESGLPGMENMEFTLARALAAQNIRSKKEEALQILEKLRPALPPQTGIDSLITNLKEDLGQ